MEQKTVVTQPPEQVFLACVVLLSIGWKTSKLSSLPRTLMSAFLKESTQPYDLHTLTESEFLFQFTLLVLCPSGCCGAVLHEDSLVCTLPLSLVWCCLTQSQLKSQND